MLMAAPHNTRTAAPALDVVALGHATRGLGLNVAELEELLVAVGDREDQADAAARARLGRGRAALELELARLLEE